jgi:radical SAM-linked protein
VDIDSYTTRERDLAEPLPWDHIDCGVTKEFQKQEWEKALEESETPDCRGGSCNVCGVCDLETVKPLTFQAETAFKTKDDRDEVPEKGPYKMLRLSYAKRGQAKYFGHLELVKIFIRSFKRSRISLRFSEGFHPAPKISFEAALPVGTESLSEHLVVEVGLNVAPRTVIDRLNQELPEGLRITGCRMVHRRMAGHKAELMRYSVTLKQGFFTENKLRGFLESEAWPLTKTNRKGHRKTIDLKPLVRELRLLGPQRADVCLDVQTGCSVRPADVLIHVFGLSDEDMKLAAIVKQAGKVTH